MYNVWYIRQRIEGGKYLVEVEVEIEKSDKEYFEIFECLSIIYTLADIHWKTRRPPTTYKVIDKHHHILIDWKSRTPDRRRTHQDVVLIWLCRYIQIQQTHVRQATIRK